MLSSPAARGPSVYHHCDHAYVLLHRLRSHCRLLQLHRAVPGQLPAGPVRCGTRQEQHAASAVSELPRCFPGHDEATSSVQEPKRCAAGAGVMVLRQLMLHHSVWHATTAAHSSR